MFFKKPNVRSERIVSNIDLPEDQYGTPSVLALTEMESCAGTCGASCNWNTCGHTCQWGASCTSLLESEEDLNSEERPYMPGM